MDKNDLRKLTPSALSEKKEQIIRLKQKGYSGKEISELTLVSESHVSRIWQAYAKGGMKAIKPKKRGRKAGDGKLLAVEQEKEIRKSLSKISLLADFRGDFWLCKETRNAHN